MGSMPINFTSGAMRTRRGFVAWGKSTREPMGPVDGQEHGRNRCVLHHADRKRGYPPSDAPIS